MSRERNRATHPTAPGTLETYWGDDPLNKVYGSDLERRHQHCADTIMSPPYTTDHPLLMVERRMNALRVSGPIHGPLSYRSYYNNYNPANRTGFQYAPHVNDATAVDWTYWKTKALSSMNPYKPVFNYPTALYELRELPIMLRSAGRYLMGWPSIDDYSGVWLSYKFGWDALANDLVSLFTWTDSVEARKKFFKNLEHGTRVKRILANRILGTSDQGVTTIAGRTGAEDAPVFQASVMRTERLKVWFTANGKMVSPHMRDPDELDYDARRAVLGLSLNPAIVWDTIPWTWLIDYFINAGDYISAIDGFASVKTTRMNIMARTTLDDVLVDKHHATGPNGTAISSRGGNASCVVKRRTVYSNPTPMLAFKPFITKGQWAILGSLFVLKAAPALSGLIRGF